MARPKRIRSCDWCGIDYQYRPNVFATGMGRFCGKPCSNRSRRQADATRFAALAIGMGTEPAHVPGIGACVLWMAARDDDGYGLFSLAERRQVMAHRFAWELANGPIPTGLSVLHRCDNPPCVRVDHLFVGTLTDNSDDKVAKRRHRYGESMPNAKLNDDMVRAIRRRHANGESIPSLAAAYNVTHGAVYFVVQGQSWRHVT